MDRRLEQMVSQGLISESEAQVLANNAAMEAYESNVPKSEFDGSRNNVNNLLSTIEGAITRVATAENGTFPSEYVEVARTYQQQLHEAGGIQNLNLSRDEINGLLDEVTIVRDSNPEALMAEYEAIEIAAAPLQDGKSDEEVFEEAKEAYKLSRSSEKAFDPIDNIVVNETTGTQFVKNPDGSLTPYIDVGSDEYIAEVSASSDEQFMYSGGAHQNSIFDGLVDK